MTVCIVSGHNDCTYMYITKTLLDLHWLPIHQRILFKILILTNQAYHKIVPQHLCDLIMPYSNNRNLRSDNMLLIAPCHPRAKLKSYGERSFQYAAPTEWNKLPLLIRESPSLDIFKTQLERFYLNSYWNFSYYYHCCFILISYCAHSFLNRYIFILY